MLQNKFYPLTPAIMFGMFLAFYLVTRGIDNTVIETLNMLFYCLASTLGVVNIFNLAEMTKRIWLDIFKARLDANQAVLMTVAGMTQDQIKLYEVMFGVRPGVIDKLEPHMIIDDNVIELRWALWFLSAMHDGSHLPAIREQGNKDTAGRTWLRNGRQKATLLTRALVNAGACDVIAANKTARVVNKAHCLWVVYDLCAKTGISAEKLPNDVRNFRTSDIE